MKGKQWQAVAAGCLLSAVIVAGEDPKPNAGKAPAAIPAKAAGAGLGIETGAVPEALRAHLGLGADKGAMVMALRRGGPGDQAGLKKFDVLLELDGQPIDSAAGLAKLLAQRAPSATAKLRYMTSARFADAEATLGPPDAPARQLAKSDDDHPVPRGGLGGEGLPKDIRDRLRELQALQARRPANFGLIDADAVAGGNFGISSRMITFTDATGQHSVQITTTNGRRRVTIHGADAEGRDYDFTAAGTLAEVKKAVKESPKLPEAVRTKALEALGTPDGE